MRLIRHAVRMGEALREAACLGNIHAVKNMIQNGANINSANSMNGWTALHWACKRDHAAIVQYLLQNEADVNLKTLKGELPSHLTSSPAILTLLGVPVEEQSSSKQSDAGDFNASKLPSFVPNYLSHPPFPYYDDVAESVSTRTDSNSAMLSESTAKLSISDEKSPRGHMQQIDVDQRDDKGTTECELSNATVGEILASGAGITTKTATPLVVKVRVCDSEDSDFIEVELPSLTYSALLQACCKELEVGSSEVTKIRKLPNVWVRKDKDVQRMREGQELEVILN